MQRRNGNKSRFVRYAGGPTSVTAQYHVGHDVVSEIRNFAPVHGSQARALHVGTEILIRLERPVQVSREAPAQKNIHRYKLLPRTIDLIDKLSKTYGDPDQVIRACVEVLKRGPDPQSRRDFRNARLAARRGRGVGPLTLKIADLLSRGFSPPHICRLLAVQQSRVQMAQRWLKTGLTRRSRASHGIH